MNEHRVTVEEAELAGLLLHPHQIPERTFLFHTDHPEHGPGWMCFGRPSRTAIAWQTEQVHPLLAEVEAHCSGGGYAGGYVAFGAAPAFEPAMRVRSSNGAPLAAFHFFDRPPKFAKFAVGPSGIDVDWSPELTEGRFRTKFASVRRWLEDGTTYQVNLTFQMEARNPIDPVALLADLAADGAPPYSACYRDEHTSLLSLSPELFFERHGERLRSKPMKGTARPADDPSGDASVAERLRGSPKERAENLMVVDMIRNDMGRLAKPGSVRVPRLFDVETYPTVLQMTSTIEARTGASLPEIFAALFPCSSVVGAPKIETMRLIADLEHSPRGVYTGAIGWVAPGRRAEFSVGIRTMVRQNSSSLRYGVGSGIVWDSSPDDEWTECLLKAEALRRRTQQFALLETMRWTPNEGFWLLDEHLCRLERAARVIEVSLDISRVGAMLSAEATAFDAPKRCRLLVGLDGNPTLEATDLLPPPARLMARLAREPIRSNDPALRLKTNRRWFYERHLRQAGADEALLWNERGELCEFCNGNLAVVLNGQRVTPPASAGLLEGTYRSHLLARGEIVEAPIRIEDLPRCASIERINAVAGAVAVDVLTPLG